MDHFPHMDPEMIGCQASKQERNIVPRLSFSHLADYFAEDAPKWGVLYVAYHGEQVSSNIGPASSHSNCKDGCEVEQQSANEQSYHASSGFAFGHRPLHEGCEGHIKASRGRTTRSKGNSRRERLMENSYTRRTGYNPFFPMFCAVIFESNPALPILNNSNYFAWL